jgi:mono/diheme cytochrome c family protein
MRILLALALTALAGCYQKMATQPMAHRPLEPNGFFSDNRSSRPPVPGTVARGQLHTNRALYEGRDDKGGLVTLLPFDATPEVMMQGRQGYDVYCAICHGVTGKGDGRIVLRGFTKPPDLALDDSRGYALKGEKMPLTKAPVGYIYEVIVKGHGAMPDHADLVPVNTRWAITAYIRALQAARQGDTRKEGAP